MTLDDSADTAEPAEFADERLSLMLRRLRELIGPLADESSDSEVGDGACEPQDGTLRLLFDTRRMARMIRRMDDVETRTRTER